MFKVNDIVTYGINGVCEIVDIQEKCLMDTKKNYFVLKPLNDKKSTCFVPTDSEVVLNKIHKLLSKDEIDKLIDSMSNEEIKWIDNEKKRKEYYKNILFEGNHVDLIRMIKSIYLEKKEREKSGKKLHISDERFLKDAEKLLYGEFEYVLNLSQDELTDYIFSRIEGNIK